MSYSVEYINLMHVLYFSVRNNMQARSMSSWSYPDECEMTCSTFLVLTHDLFLDIDRLDRKEAGWL
jgi:hypothetical protein